MKGWRQVLRLAIVSAFALMLVPASAQNSDMSIQIAGPTRIPIKEFMWIASQHQGITFVMDDALDGGSMYGAVDVIVKSSVNKENPMEKSGFEIPHDQLLSFLASFLKQKRHCLIREDEKVYTIVSVNEALVHATDSLNRETVRDAKLECDRFVTVNFDLNYCNANAARTALAPLATRGAQVVPIGNSQLMVSDYLSNAKRIATIVENLDKPLKIQGYSIPESVDPDAFARAATDVAGVKGEVFPDLRRFVYRCEAGHEKRVESILVQCAAALTSD